MLGMLVQIQGEKEMKQCYHIILRAQKEGGYTICIPELKGCISQGETTDEALCNIGDALHLYMSTKIELEKRRRQKSKMSNPNKTTRRKCSNGQTTKLTSNPFGFDFILQRNIDFVDEILVHPENMGSGTAEKWEQNKKDLLEHRYYTLQELRREGSHDPQWITKELEKVICQLNDLKATYRKEGSG